MTDRPVHPLAEVFPPLSDREYAALKASIAVHGVLDPVIYCNGELVDGRHRSRAAAELNVPCPRREIDGDALGLALAGNLRRRHLSAGLRAVCAARLVDTPRAGGRVGGEAVTAARAAALFDVSERSVKTARAVLTEAPGPLVEAVVSGEVGPVDAERGWARLKGGPDAKARAVEALEFVRETERDHTQGAKSRIRYASAAARLAMQARAAVAPPPPAGRYGVIVLDPPWKLDRVVQRQDRDGRDQFPGDATRGMTGLDYDLMEFEEIEALPVEARLADDAWVFLWTVQRFLRRSFELLDRWGAGHYRTLAWIKNGGPQLPGGPCSNVEYCLIGRRGTPSWHDTRGFKLGYRWPRRGHSVKPAEFFDLVERVAGPTRRLEWFARGPREGWDVTGNEAS